MLALEADGHIQVTLPDGSTAGLETLATTYRVSDGLGDIRRVEGITVGDYDQEEASGMSNCAVYRLNIEDGYPLTASGTQPIMTPDGPVPLHRLAPGDTILTDQGYGVHVTSVDPMAFVGRMYNLTLGKEHRDEGLIFDAVRTYVANGILVGDLTCEKVMHQNITHYDPGSAQDLPYCLESRH